MFMWYYKPDGTKTNDFVEISKAFGNFLRKPPLWFVGALAVVAVVDTVEDGVRCAKKHLSVLRAVL